MDEQQLRDHAQAHGRAVVTGDMPALTEDFAEELRPQMRELAKALPRKMTGAEVTAVEAAEDHGIAEIVYAGDDDRTVTIRSRWEERDGRPRIVDAHPV
jgi:molybdopterin-guanine dinucleotide biosynthesis protein A